MRTRLRRLICDSQAQDLAEYALLLTLITLALVVAVTLIGSTIAAAFNAVAAAF